MDEPALDTRPAGSQPADKASGWAVGVAFASILCAGIGASLANSVGLLALVIAGLAWLFAWTLGMGLAVGSLRNAYSSLHPADVRKKSWAAIVVSVVSLGLVVAYIFAIVIAAQRIVEGT